MLPVQGRDCRWQGPLRRFKPQQEGLSWGPRGAELGGLGAVDATTDGSEEMPYLFTVMLAFYSVLNKRRVVIDIISMYGDMGNMRSPVNDFIQN
jgi:hypothetical protein